MHPKISIVIPTYNRAGFLRECIESALRQTYANLEILVMDNASSDATPSIVKSFLGDARLRYIPNDNNIGMVRNWRRGVYEFASGDWFMILSDDDYLIDDAYISKAADIIRSRSDLVVVYANGFVREEHRSRMLPLKLPFTGIVQGRDVFLSRGMVTPQDFTLCNVLFHRAKAMELDAFSNPGNICADSELFLRLCLRGQVGVCSDTVSVYRVHSSNLIGRFEKNFDQLLQSLDWVFIPYAEARRANLFSPPELDAWEKRVVVSLLRWSLKKLWRNFRSDYKAGVHQLEQRHAALSPTLAQLPRRYQLDTLGNLLRLFRRRL